MAARRERQEQLGRPSGGCGNRVLEAVQAEERRRLVGQCEVEEWDLHEHLIQPGQHLHSVYFPLTAVMAVLTTMDDGYGAEIATVGNEGVVGVPVFLGTRVMGAHDLVAVQVPGTVLRIDAQAFVDSAHEGSSLRAVVERYAQIYLRQISQQVACNAMHTIEERCARWILATSDRVGGDEFPLSYETVAQTLGLPVTDVAVARGTLQSARFVRLTQGRIRILDRDELEAVSCECYESMRRELDRLLAPVAG